MEDKITTAQKKYIKDLLFILEYGTRVIGKLHIALGFPEHLDGEAIESYLDHCPKHEASVLISKLKQEQAEDGKAEEEEISEQDKWNDREFGHRERPINRF